MANPSAKRFAVLVGVDYYQNAARTLRGAVSDVLNMQAYLKLQGIQEIQTFVASKPSDSQSNLPDGASSQWATYENIFNHMKSIIKDAGVGDHVYFHFCGHGTQTPPTSKYSHAQTGDLALVLFDEKTGARYLRGMELAALLKEVVQKKAFVTVVLDCCHSGSVVRHGDIGSPGVRGVKYDPVIDATYPLNHSILPRSSRDIQNLRDWLLDPQDYTIIVACGPHETAEELKVGSGALSSFLLSSLKASTGNPTIQSLYDHLRLKFHVYRPVQTPICFGRKDVSFFGNIIPENKQRQITVLKVRGTGGFVMDAGLAQGVRKGDEYALYPLFPPESSSSEPEKEVVPLRARVEQVLGTTSKLEITNTLSPNLHNESRWYAKPLSLSSWSSPVRLPAGTPEEVEQWTSAMTNKRFIVPSHNESSGLDDEFQVAKLDDGGCHILDRSGNRIRHLPTMPYTLDGRSFGKIASVLEHLATFKYIEAIENQTPVHTFEESFTVSLEDKSKNQYKSGQTLTVKNNEKVQLSFVNHGNGTLYLTIFDMGPRWQIQDILSGGGEMFRVLAPKGMTKTFLQHTGSVDIPLSFSVPDELVGEGHQDCEDIIKVFITSKASSFAAMVAPKLPLSATEYAGPSRGRHNSGALAEFLSGLALPVRGPTPDLPDENWVTRAFFVRTVRE